MSRKLANDRRMNLIALGWLCHAAGAGGLLAVGLIYHSVVSTKLTRQEEKQAAETTRLEKLLETAGQTRSQHKRLTENLSQIERRAETTRQRIPDQPREAEFLQQLAQAADLEGLKILDYRLGTTTLKDTHSQVDVRLTCQGGYANVCGFLDRLAGLERVATVDKMDLLGGTDSGVYPLDMTLTLYFGARDNKSKG